MRPILALCWCVVLVGVACTRPVNGGTMPAEGADAFPLTVAEVRTASGLPGFTRVLDDDQAVPDGVTPSGPCRALFDSAAAFGDNRIEFRTVADEADLDTGGPLPLIASVGQTVVVYPSEDAARQTFVRRAAQLGQCSELDLPYLGGTISQPEPDTTVYRNGEWTLVSTIDSAVLVDVSVGALPESERIATEISRAIVERNVCLGGAKRNQLC